MIRIFNHDGRGRANRGLNGGVVPSGANFRVDKKAELPYDYARIPGGMGQRDNGIVDCEIQDLTVITGAYLIVFALALGLALLLAPLAIWMARRFGVVAVAGGRRVNEGDRRGVPKLGGVVLYGSFITAVITAQLLPVPRDDPKEIIRLVGLIAGATVMFVAGVLDDARELRPIPQFMAQFLAAAIAILFQIFIEFFNNPLSGQQTDAWPFVVTVTLTFFWLVGMMNTVNWLDGLDGLAAGVGLIAGIMLFINGAFEVQPPQTSVSLLPLALMGACLGFLLFNFYPARQFLGGGAPLLGFILGTLSIIGGAKMAAILLVMGLPLLDAVWQVVSRMLHGKSPFSGDRGHIHFRLLDMGFSQRQIVVTYYLFCAFFGALTLLVESQLYKFIAFGVMALLVAVGFVVLLRSQRQNAA